MGSLQIGKLMLYFLPLAFGSPAAKVVSDPAPDALAPADKILRIEKGEGDEQSDGRENPDHDACIADGSWRCQGSVRVMGER